MKKKQIITILSVVFALSMLFTAFTGCNKGKHKFSEEWKFDETAHWHECMTKKHTDTSEKIPHDFNDGVVTTQPTEEAEGVKTFTCNTCGYKKTGKVAKLAHTHKFDKTKWKYDDKEHWHEATCEHKTERDSVASHNWDDGVITKEPNYGVVGEKKLTCTKCGYEKTETIAALGAKDNEIKLVAGKTLGKEYDGQIVAITKDDFVIEGNRVPTIMFKVKGADDNTYTATAPKKAGEYTVKVSAEGTAEWKAATKTFDFAIAKKVLTATGTKVYDGNATMPVTLTGVVAGETVTVTITMASKNAGATVKEVVLAGADKDNYVIDTADVVASITKKEISGLTVNKSYTGEKEFEWDFDSSDIVASDDIRARITMESANVGAKVQSFKITGKDAGNYSLAIEDVNVAIVKANINFEISNADKFTEFFVGATNIPDPTTNYVEIGEGYGDRDYKWQKNNGGGAWSPALPKSMVRENPGEWRVCIQYEDGINYNLGKTEYVYFNVKAKPRTLTVKNFTGKTYDGKTVANFTYATLEDIVTTTDIPGVNDIKSPYDGDKYVEYRKKGETLWTKVTDTYIPKNAAEYEYRIGITATDEWEAVVSNIKSFTIAQVEIKLEKGYVAINNNLQNGELFLATHSPVAGESVALRLVNEKAGLELTAPGSGYLKKDQKKQVSVQNNLDCFKLVKGTNTNINNYKLVKSAGQTSVEIAVVPSGKGASNQIQEAWKSTDGKQLFLDTSVKTGYFKVGQTVEIYNSTGTTKLFEAKIVKVHVGIGTNSKEAQSGCVIPSDGMVRIDIDVTGITYSGTIKGGTVRVK